MFVLGIDPGLTRTGYGLVRRGRGMEAVAFGVIRTEPSGPMSVRLAELYTDLAAVITQHQPDVVAIERVFTNRNRQTAIAVGRASGVVMLAAAQAGLEVHEYSPTAVKLAVAGDGAAAKTAVAEMVARRLRLSVIGGPADVADAIAIAMCHLQQVRVPAGRRT
jgi:crossover junction endodeoxyribonuclease RuvC